MQKLVHLRHVKNTRLGESPSPFQVSFVVTVKSPRDLYLFIGPRNGEGYEVRWSLFIAALTNLFVDFMVEWEHQTDVFHVSRKCWDSSQEKWQFEWGNPGNPWFLWDLSGPYFQTQVAYQNQWFKTVVYCSIFGVIRNDGQVCREDETINHIHLWEYEALKMMILRTWHEHGSNYLHYTL